MDYLNDLIKTIFVSLFGLFLFFVFGFIFLY